MNRIHIISLAATALLLTGCTTPEEYDFSNKGGTTNFGDAVQLDAYGRNPDQTITFSENSGSADFKVENVSAQTGEVIIPPYVIYKGRRYAVTTLTNRSFSNCKAKTVTLPATITTIGDNVFGNEQLTIINLNATVPPTVGSRILSGAVNAVILVPQSVLNNYKMASAWSEYAHRISYIGDTSWLNKPATNAEGQPVSYITENSSDGVLKYTLNAGDLTAAVNDVSGSDFDNYTVPAELHHYFDVYTVTALDKQSFSYTSKMKSITLPASITQLGSRTFYSCTSLRQIALPDAITQLPEECFSGCNELTTVTMPASLTSIGDNAFYSCKALYSIELPATVTTIGNRAFSNCTALESVTCRATTPPSIGSQSFTFNNSQQCVIRVPAASVDAYKQAPNWRNLADRIVAM